MEAWVGTSGWSYKDWRGRIYPAGLAQRDWLPWYATRFPTVELNASFYRLPTPTMIARWRAVTPAGFRFSVKMSRFVTHIRRLRDAEPDTGRFLDLARGLGDRLGPVLVQLPPTFGRDDELLDGFLDTIPPDVRVAIEFRHRSWASCAVRERLATAGAAWVLADRPHARVAPLVTSDWTYVRFHQGADDSPWYARAKLRRWAERLARFDVATAFVYFNNDPDGAAFENAGAFAELLADRGVQVRRSSAEPPEVFRAKRVGTTTQ